MTWRDLLGLALLMLCVPGAGVPAGVAVAAWLDLRDERKTTDRVGR